MYPQAKPTPATTINWGYLPYFVNPQIPLAVSQGYTNASGINVQYVKGFGTSTDVFTAMVSGAVDMSFLSVSPAALKLVQQGTLKMVGGSEIAIGGNNATNSVGVIVSNALWQKGVRTPLDLLNYTIVANLQGSPQTFEFEQWARSYNLSYSQFHFTYITSASEINAAFQTGKADVIIQAQPWVTTAINEGGHVIAWDAQMLPKGYVYAFGALYVTTSFANAHPNALKAFLNDWVEASAFYTQNQNKPFSNSNTTAIATAAANFVGVSVSAIESQTWPYISPTGGLSASGIASVQSIFYSDGLLTQNMNVTSFFIPGVTLLIPTS